jgi:hypothetical protein
LDCGHVCKTCAFHDDLQAGKQIKSTHRTPLIWRPALDQGSTVGELPLLLLTNLWQWWEVSCAPGGERINFWVTLYFPHRYVLLSELSPLLITECYFLYGRYVPTATDSALSNHFRSFRRNYLCETLTYICMS